MAYGAARDLATLGVVAVGVFEGGLGFCLGESGIWGSGP